MWGRITGNRPAARIQDVFEKEASKTPRDFEEELLAVWRATNEERARVGKGPIPLSAVKSAESCALGHTDYSLKLALGCERLVGV